MGIVDWLTGWFRSAASIVAQPIVDMVHWAVHALGSVILAVFDHVFGAWAALWAWTEHYFVGFTWLIHMIGRVLVDIKRVIIPYIIRWVKAGFLSVEKFIHWVYDTVSSAIVVLRKFVIALVAKTVTWVIQHVWTPLKNLADWLYQHLLLWGYTAWWWITHLANLADALIFHLVNSLERNAWEIAGKLGQFALALVVRNLARFLQLAESIISAVL